MSGWVDVHMYLCSNSSLVCSTICSSKGYRFGWAGLFFFLSFFLATKKVSKVTFVTLLSFFSRRKETRMKL